MFANFSLFTFLLLFAWSGTAAASCFDGMISGIRKFIGASSGPKIESADLASRQAVDKFELRYSQQNKGVMSASDIPVTQDLETVKKLKDQFPDLKTIDDSDLMALRRYTHAGDQLINPCLRSQQGCTNETLALARGVKTALEKMPAHSGEVTRVMRLEEDQIKKLFGINPYIGGEKTLKKVGKVYSDPSFMSTKGVDGPKFSFTGNERSLLRQNKGMAVRMNIKTTAKKCRVISHISINGGAHENEVLCLPGAKFRVLESKITDLSSNNDPIAVRTLVLRLEEVD